MDTQEQYINVVAGVHGTNLNFYLYCRVVKSLTVIYGPDMS